MTERGRGTTTKQMEECPIGAVYVWCNSKIDYPSHLAQRLGRGDLKIKSPSFFEGSKWRGVQNIVVDHAFDAHLSNARISAGYIAWLKTVALTRNAPGKDAT